VGGLFSTLHVMGRGNKRRTCSVYVRAQELVFRPSPEAQQTDEKKYPVPRWRTLITGATINNRWGKKLGQLMVK